MNGVHNALLDFRDGEGGVVARRYRSACFLDCGNGGGAGAGDDDVDWGVQVLFSSGEEFDAVFFYAVEAAGRGEFFQCDGLGRVEAVGGYPVLDFVEVYGGEFGGESVWC